MARSRKTQQPDDTTASPDPAQIAQHFMQIWQDQWQHLAQQNVAQGQTENPFAALQKHWLDALNPMFGMPATGFSGSFGHNQPHDSRHVPSDPTAVAALELATAAVAASEQCLELLKQCAHRLDELDRRTAAVARPAKPKTSAKPAAQRSRKG